MKKQRIVCIITAFLLLLPIFTDIVRGGLDAYAVNNDPFSYYDRQRDALLENRTVSSHSFSPSKGGDKYIVAFAKDADRREVYKAVKDYDFSLPAYSSELVFVMYIHDFDAFSTKYASILRYALPDTVAAECKEFHAEYAENVIIGADEAITSGGSGVVVAVLDSGIDREADIFSESDILDGMDCILDRIGVYDDAEGHGTRVSAIIVSSETGVARGASLLPVKITDDAHKIMTSDLVEGLYYAADYGADVINMSFGGYFENIAEKEAISYAASKGCILVASAGNEGNDPELAGKMSYPASFDDVISVASVNASGEASAFSQYNEMVDIASPGEMLHLYGKDETSPYEELSGTSYATAYVSAAAALAVSHSERVLGHDGFEKLLEYSASVSKNSRTGYGVINIPRLLESLNKPVVNGVSSGKVYFEEVRAYFENASALLDGEEYESGDPIFSQGSHTLVVADDYGSIEIKFDVDTMPLTYDIENGNGWVAITFDYGDALLDGEKYVSGTRITGIGSHRFVLTGQYGNSVSETVFISYDLPSVYGVEDGGEYDRGIYITSSDGGHTYLNGEEFKNGIFVGKKGDYVLRITDDSARFEKEIRFSLLRDASDAGSDAPYGRMTHTGRDGIIVFWQNGEDSFSVCRDTDITTQTVVKTKGNIVSVGAYNGVICAVTTDGWYYYDALSPSSCVASEKPENGAAIVSASYSEGRLVYVDSDGNAVFVDGENTSSYRFGGMNTVIESVGQTFYLYSAMNPSSVCICDGEWKIRQLPNYPMMFRLKAGNGIVCIGNTVYDGGVENILCELPDMSRVLWCGGNVLITSDRLFSSDGNVSGVYPDEISFVCRHGERTYSIYSDGRYSYTDDTVSFGSFVSDTTLTGKIQNVRPYEYIIPIVGGKKIKDACFDRASGLIAVICENDNRLYYIDPESGENTKNVVLKYAPSSLRGLENGAAVVFMNSSSLYLTRTDEYVVFPARVSDVCVSDGRLFAVCGGKLCEYVSEENIIYHFDGMTTDSLVGGSGMIFVSSDYELYFCRVSDMTVISSKKLFFRGRLALSQNCVFAGNSVYTVDTAEEMPETKGTVLAVMGNSVITDTGLYSARDGRKLSDFRESDTVVISDGFDTFFFGDSSVTVLRSDGDMTEDAVIDGVADGGTYDAEATFGVSKGKVYLDGTETENTFTVTEGGKHRLRVVLPWGMTKELTFTVISHPESVSVTEELTIASGKTVKLSPSVTPKSSDVKYTYSVVSGDSASVNARGYVTAVSQGVTVIRVGVEGTELEAFVTVTVREKAIVTNNEKYHIDRENELIKGIEANTSVSDFLSCFDDFESTHILTFADSAPVKDGIVCTGMILKKYTSSGSLTDSLVLAVKGDLDGDGRNTLNDSAILYELLKSGKYKDVSVRNAADVNLNGSVTVSDFKALRSVVGYDADAEGYDGYTHITCPAFVYRGGTFYVTFRNDGIHKASAVSGEFVYDPSALELLKIEYYYGEIYTEPKSGNVKYSAYGIENLNPDTRLFRMYFYVKPTATPGMTDLGLVNTNLRRNKAYTLSDRHFTPEIKTDPKDLLAVSSPNSDLDFAENVTEYDVTIPLSDERLILDIDCPAHHYVYYTDVVVPEEGYAKMIVEYVTPSKVVDYVLNIHRGLIHITESDPSLFSVIVTGGSLETEFSPDITEYTVIGDGEVTYSVLPVGSRTQVEYVYSDDGRSCKVVCVAENGNVKEYTFTLRETVPDVSEEEPSEESSEESEFSEQESEESSVDVPEESSLSSEAESIPEPSEGSAGTVIAICAAALTAGSAVFVVLYRRKKQKNN